MAIIDVVKWDGTPDIFAWKFPEENLTTFTQLIVNQSQEALLFRKGAMFAKFGPGKHTLSTENIPVLENLYGIPFGGQNPFTAEVWFVNKVDSLDIKWGTLQPFLVRDPEFQMAIPVRGFGQFGVRIVDAETFVVKLVGRLTKLEKNLLVEYFKGMLMSRATSSISRVITEQKVGVLDLAMHLSEISEALKQDMLAEFGKYGIELVNFYVSRMAPVEDDPSVKRLTAALAKRAEMNLLGYNYQQERSFDTLEKAAANPGASGTLMGAGMGLGMGLGAGQAVGGMMTGVMNNVQPTVACACGGQMNASARFCPSCGKPNGGKTAASKILCNKCNQEIPENSKFCPGCGDPYNPCPKCRGDVPAEAAKCPVCGEAMPVPCPECGAGVASDAKFCHTCGKSVRPACPSCGKETGLGQAFCGACGAKIPKEEA